MTIPNKNIWFLIPARAGSKTIPRKNIRELAGKPLIAHVLDTINSIAAKDQIIVSTDDEDVVHIADSKAIIHERSPETADDKSTLDDVAMEITEYLLAEKGATEEDVLITCQPTSPFISKETIETTIQNHSDKKIDTILSVVDDRHLRWTVENGSPKPLYKERVNRQQMRPVYAETGGVISSTLGHILKNKTRIGDRISIIELSEKEGLDIDTFSDWALAEYWANKLRIFIRVDGSRGLGFGHLYRSLAIAQNIQAHDIYFVTQINDDYQLGYEFLKKWQYPVIEIQSNESFIKQVKKLTPDIVINDILDTNEKYINQLKKANCFVVNFEDMGKGNRKADVVINDLYPDIYPQKNHWYGVEHAILNPNFERVEPRSKPRKDVQDVLIAYGGTDPSNLTEKALDALTHLGFDKNITIVLGPGHPHFQEIEKRASKLEAEVSVLHNISNMAALMQRMDLALTSAGRTVTELMTLGVPTIAMCQNNREMRHNHASSTYGIVNLGLGKSISSKVLAEHIQVFIDDHSLRIDMHARMKKAIQRRSNAAIVSKILNEYKRKKVKPQ